MTENPDRECNDCGSTEWKEIEDAEKSYTGNKEMGSRSETVRQVFVCKECGREGRKFTDGVDGEVTWSGAFR